MMITEMLDRLLDMAKHDADLKEKLLKTICFAPILFVGWCLVKTIEIVVGFLKFDLRCAAVKKEKSSAVQTNERRGL